MLPIGDDTTGRKTFPYMNYAIIVACFIVFLIELSQGNAFIQQYSVTPANLLANPVGLFYTVFTAMFMHASWLHILGNMLFLWIFGDNVEDAFGHFRYLLFYLLCGIIATFAQVFAGPTSTVPNLGASGAIAGVMAAYLVLFPGQRVRVLLIFFVVNLRAWLVIGLWIAIQVFSELVAGPSGGVAYMAHIGGFSTGLLITFLVRGKLQRLRQPSIAQ